MIVDKITNETGAEVVSRRPCWANKSIRSNHHKCDSDLTRRKLNPIIGLVNQQSMIREMSNDTR